MAPHSTTAAAADCLEQGSSLLPCMIPEVGSLMRMVPVDCLCGWWSDLQEVTAVYAWLSMSLT
jgi:hypothetical protein